MPLFDFQVIFPSIFLAIPLVSCFYKGSKLPYPFVDYTHTKEEHPMSEQSASSALSRTPPAQIVEGRIIAEVGTTVWIPIEFFVPNLEQPRKWFDPDELQSTAESYEHRGDVEDAVKVVLRNDGTIAFIVDGESRWRAAKIAKLAGLSAYIMAPMSDDEIYLSSAVANIRRRDFSIIEKALAIFEIQQRFGLNQTEAGRRLGYKPATTAYLLKFLELDEPIQNLLMQGKLGSGVAFQLAKYKIEDQRKMLQTIKEEVKNNGGKPIHPNRVARILRGAAEKKGIQPKQASRGRDHYSHAQLVGRNLLTKLETLLPALREFKSLSKKEVEKLRKPHYLDIISGATNARNEIGKMLEQMESLT